MLAALRSARYDSDRARGGHLAFLIDQEVVAWAYHDPTTGRHEALYAAKGTTVPALDKLPALPREVTFVALPEWSALVPESALTPGSEPAHLSLLHGQLPSGMLRDEPIDQLGARCIFMHDDQAEQAVLERYPAARPIALRTLLVRTALRMGRDRTVLTMHAADKRLDITLVETGRLRLSNTFPIVGAVDMLYYVLLVLERTGHDPHATHVRYGGLGFTDDMRTLLERYLPLAAPAMLRVHPTLEGLDLRTPEHWAALLEQAACAS